MSSLLSEIFYQNGLSGEMEMEIKKHRTTSNRPRAGVSGKLPNRFMPLNMYAMSHQPSPDKAPPTNRYPVGFDPNNPEQSVPTVRYPKWLDPKDYTEFGSIPQSNREIPILQEIFQEFEDEFDSQEFEDNHYDDSLPPTRRDGAAARAVDRQKATDQMPPTRRDGTASRAVDQQKVNSMSFKNGSMPKRFAGQLSPSPKGKRFELELSVLDEIFQEVSF